MYPCCCEEVVSSSKPDGQRLGDGLYGLMEVQLWIKWAEVFIFVSEWNGLVFFLSWVVTLPGSFAIQLSPLLEVCFGMEMESVTGWGSGLFPLFQSSPLFPLGRGCELLLSALVCK